MITVTKFEKIIIPNALDGQKFADEYIKNLVEIGAFRGREEDTASIVIKAQYHFSIFLANEELS